MYEDEFKKKHPDKEFSGVSYLPNGEQFFICTNSAIFVIKEMGEGELYGFSSEENPSATHSEIQGSDGHDFALLRGRYIVDLWISHFTGCEEKVVYDLLDKRDHAKIKEIYGDLNAWKRYDNDQKTWVPYRELPDVQRPKLKVVGHTENCVHKMF